MNMIVHKVTPQQARYTPAGGREKCSFCRFYIAPKWCGHVTGPVSPMGWCKYFSQEMRQQFGGSTVTSGIPAGATLSLDFMSSGNMPAGVTFTRASPATYTDSTGTSQTAAVDQPRWDYANGVLRGLLIEEARTNLLLNSATLGTQGVAVTAQAYTLSFYGTGTITKSGAATGALVGAGAGQRVSQTFTPTAGTLTLTVTGSVTNAQLEAGSFATSWISTSGATAARAQDNCSLPAASVGAWFTATGTWLAEFSPLTNGAGNNLRVIGVIPGASAVIYTNPSSFVSQYDGAASMSVGNAIVSALVMKAVTSWTPGAAKACLNAGAVATAGTLTSGYYGNITGFGVTFMGTTAAADVMSGYLRRINYWPRALSDAEMQQVTI